MKNTFNVACIFLKSVWQAVSLRSALTALLLAPLATLNAGRYLPGLPTTGKLRTQICQSLENSGALASNDWN